MKQNRRQISIAKSIDSEIVDFFEKQSNVSKTVMLGMQILYEIFGNIDIKAYLPPGIEAHNTPVTFDKLFRLAHGISYKDYVAPSEENVGGSIPNLSGQQLQQILLALAQQPNGVAVPPATNERNQLGQVNSEHHNRSTLVEGGIQNNNGELNDEVNQVQLDSLTNANKVNSIPQDNEGLRNSTINSLHTIPTHEDGIQSEEKKIEGSVEHVPFKSPMTDNPVPTTPKTDAVDKLWTGMDPNANFDF